jgi:RNA polymerase sigma-70 factor (ECF subfamily)
VEPTSTSLLAHVRDPGNRDAWQRFVHLYAPLLYSWTRRLGLQTQDAADMVQDVFVVLVQQLPRFSYDRHKSFRAWLRTILVNKWRDRQRHDGAIGMQGGDITIELTSPPGDAAADLDEQEYRQYLVSRAMEIMVACFQPITWRACWENVVAGRDAKDVARELGISVNAVYVAKSKVLRRLRQELDGLWD